MAQGLSHSARVLKLGKLIDEAQIGSPGIYGSLGIHVMLWLFIVDHAPDGDLGSFTYDDMAEVVGWDKRPSLLVDLLVAAGTLEYASDHRLIVKDWPEPYMAFVRGTYTGTGFHDGSERPRYDFLPPDWDKWSQPR